MKMYSILTRACIAVEIVSNEMSRWKSEVALFCHLYCTVLNLHINNNNLFVTLKRRSLP